MARVASAQEVEIIVYVDGDLLEHGGLVELTAAEFDATPDQRYEVTVSERYAKLTLLRPRGTKYTFRFRPSPAHSDRDGIEEFSTETLTVGSHGVDTPEGTVQGDYRAVRVFPFNEYGSAYEATRIATAWGQTNRGMPPPANAWGAMSLKAVFAFPGDTPVGLLCDDLGALSVCTPDPADQLLLEAKWWQAIAEARLERLRHDALRDCYDSGNWLSKPASCKGIKGRGYPEYRPAN
ncbi:hypothetical protein [Vannielia sp. SX4]|uniref:hypothetical protein n=1 Tax=Vannielia sp. SX4 TaxID=3463852 RepID=UPI004059E149